MVPFACEHSLELLPFFHREFCATLAQHAMPCWDECCVDESPEINLSGKQMADDRRLGVKKNACLIPNFGLYYIRVVLHSGRSIEGLKNLKIWQSQLEILRAYKPYLKFGRSVC